MKTKKINNLHPLFTDILNLHGIPQGKETFEMKERENLSKAFDQSSPGKSITKLTGK